MDVPKCNLETFLTASGKKIVITFNRLKIVIILSAVKVAVSRKRCPGAVGGSSCVGTRMRKRRMSDYRPRVEYVKYSLQRGFICSASKWRT